MRQDRMGISHLASNRGHQRHARQRLQAPAREWRAAERVDASSASRADWQALLRLAVVVFLTGIAIAAMRLLLQHPA